MPSVITLPSFAKINWLLRVLSKRDDGYHELCTVFQTVSLHDRLSFTASDELTLECSEPSIPVGEGNLVLQAARELRIASGVTKGARIVLEKHIPSPGGLGGGSSNAAAALIGLAKLWGLRASLEDLTVIAARLGSDVPFFLHGGTAAGCGRGEKIGELPEINERYMLLVTPGISIPTKDVFPRVDPLSLTNGSPESILRVCRFTAGSGDLSNKTLANDLEAVVFPEYPEIARIKKTLLDLGAVEALMSGSGATVFAVFDKEETRQIALKALDIESTWRKFAVATISRNEYREALDLAF
jgi:4-diphosphocytidyl-2-C-methyl-D-erythritol kinase